MALLPRREAMNIHRRTIFILALVILFSAPLFVSGIACAEDAYEENDTLESAWHPGYSWVRTWLSTIGGFGVQADDDWYQIDVDPGSVRLQVDCRFTHADGDIDIDLYDSSGILLVSSISADDNEFIDYTISSGGTYYIRIYYGNAGNTYDLRWDDLTEDTYDENDTLETAWHPGYNWERMWLSDIEGSGVQADDDWYRIDVDPGSERIQVDCQFTHADGDIDIELYDSGSTLLAQSTSVTDDEFIEYTGSVGGTYYIRVFKGNAGNTYNLWWDDSREDAYEENDTLETAWHPGYSWKRMWLSSIDGFGAQADDDWYQIDVDQGSERVKVKCQFTHAEGDIDMEFYDSTGTMLAESSSVNDNEIIDYTVSTSGAYYVRVFFGNVGNSYDLWWDDLVSGSTTLLFGLGETSGGWMELFAENYSHADWFKAQWEAYNAANGESRLATGDIDGDGRDEIVIGLGPVSGDSSLPDGRFEILDDDYTHLAWGQVQWTAYNSANGETWPACGDVDGDGQDEIVIGLGSGSGGFLEIFDYDAGSINHKEWIRVNWKGYNMANGESRPACGDLDGDGNDEIVVGLGTGSGGFFEIFDDCSAEYVHLAWTQVQWKGYNMANGESRPACGDIDGDGIDEIVVGLGTGSGGFMEVFDDGLTGYAHLAWPRVQWKGYNMANGESRPACGDIDEDGKDEIVVGLGGGAGGFMEILEDASVGFVHLAWPQIQWKGYNTANGETWPGLVE
jgi:hypothetical protein